MVILVPIHDSGCSPEPDVGRGDSSKKPGEERDQEAPAGQAAGKNGRKRKATVTDDRSHDPSEPGDQETRAAKGAGKKARGRKASSKDDRNRSQEPDEARDQELLVCQGADENARKRQATATDGRSQEPSEAGDQETRAAKGAGKKAGRRKSSSTDDRSQEPDEARDQELLTAEGYQRTARNPSPHNTWKKLQQREIGFRVCFNREKFKGIKNVILLDMYMQKNREGLENFDPFMRNRSAIAKMIPLQDVLVLLSSTGVGCIFSRVTNDMITFLTRTGEVTEDIFFNKHKHSLIVCSSSRSDNCTQKSYRSIPIGLLRTQDTTGYPIFASEKVKWLVEFDATSGKALLRDGSSHRIFDLKTYSFMYMIPEMDVAGVLCRPNALLVINENRKNLLSLVIKSMESGDDLGFIYHPTQEKLEHLELLHEKILIKERSKGLQMIDLKKTEKTEVPVGRFDYHALYGRNWFLTFQDQSSQIRKYDGTVIKELENVLWKSSANEHMICSSSDDDNVIYVAKSKASRSGSVNVYSLGREVSVTMFDPEVEVASLSYNEGLNEIYVGTRGGKVYVYSV